MIKETLAINDWEELSKAFKVGNKQFYYLRMFKKDLPGDLCVCYTELVDHQPTQEEKDELYAAYLAGMKNMVIDEIVAYDSSSAVNKFYINGIEAWLDKQTRVGLVNLLESQKKTEHTRTTLWFNGTPIELDIETALNMLYELEVYAGLCYNQTELHKANVLALVNIDDVENYGYTTGYPEYLEFEV
jgi:hypothetical protein